MAANLRRMIIAHLGGDRFAVLLPEIVRWTMKMAERSREAVALTALRRGEQRGCQP
jgi:GGDEF domain-containing protein